jgi:hypothetical protein
MQTIQYSEVLDVRGVEYLITATLNVNGDVPYTFLNTKFEDINVWYRDVEARPGTPFEVRVNEIITSFDMWEVIQQHILDNLPYYNK